MGKLFGTDGIRGVVGENLTVELAFHVGQAVATVLEEEKGSSPTILIGKDTRISSDMLEAALIAGICSVGGDVLSLGVIPTPGVAYLTVQEKADAGIVISASHNPYEHNGIKVFNGQGYKLPDEMEERVENLILTNAPMKARTGGEIGKCIHHPMLTITPEGGIGFAKFWIWRIAVCSGRNPAAPAGAAFPGTTIPEVCPAAISGTVWGRSRLVDRM